MEIFPLCPIKLPDLDSNQDKQNQNLRYYRYTIGQLRKNFAFRFPKADCKSKIYLNLDKIKIVKGQKAKGRRQRKQPQFLTATAPLLLFS